MNQSGSEAAGPPRRPRVLLPAMAASVIGVILVHITALQSGFVDFDDDTIFLNNPLLKRNVVGAFWEILSPERTDWRPLRDLSHWFDYLLHGQSPLWAHAHNLLLLSCCVWLCGRLFLALGATRRAAAWAAFLGFAHPVQVETIAWVSGRKDLLAGLFALSALLAFHRMLRSRKAVVWSIIGLICTMAGIMAKGHVIVMPALFGCLFVYRRLRVGQAFSKRIWLTGIALCVIAFVSFDLIARGGVMLADKVAADDLQHRLTLGDRLQLPLRYLWHFVWPVDLNHIYLTQKLGTAHTVLSVCSALLSVGLLVRLLSWLRAGDPRAAVLAMAMVWMAPYLHFKAGTVYMADRYLFMVVPLLCWLVYGFLDGFTLPRRLNNGLLIVIGMTWATASLQQHQAWHNPVNLWARMAEVYPESAWGYQRLGRALYFQGQTTTAAEAWLTAVNRNPKDTQSMNNAAVALMELGHLEQAQALLERCLAINPQDQRALKNLQNLAAQRP